MRINILHRGLVPITDEWYDRTDFDAGQDTYVMIGKSRWGDETLIAYGHADPFPDVIVANSSVFEYDILRMLKFILYAKTRHPWIVFVLLLSTDEEQEVVSLPTMIRKHFSRYFQLVDTKFTLEGINKWLSANRQRIEELVMSKRLRVFGKKNVQLEEFYSATVNQEREVEFEFALSFSGAQRQQARDLANVLKGRGCRVFFDEFETTSILGENLAETLYETYSAKTRYCVILVSEEYKSGPWTSHERRAALDKAIAVSDGAYILPIKIHDIDLPGLSTSIAYLSWQSNPTEIGGTLYEKLVSDMVAASATQQHRNV